MRLEGVSVERCSGFMGLGFVGFRYQGIVEGFRQVREFRDVLGLGVGGIEAHCCDSKASRLVPPKSPYSPNTYGPSTILRLWVVLTHRLHSAIVVPFCGLYFGSYKVISQKGTAMEPLGN